MHRRLPAASALLLALGAFVLLLPDTRSYGDTFEWIDRNGTVHTAPSLDQVPRAYRQSVRRIPDPKGGVLPGTSKPEAPTPAPSLEETYAPWQNRMRMARAELEALKAKREKTQAEYLDLVTQLRVRGSRIDPEKEAQTAASLKELEQLIRDKESEIATAIPDEARRAGVPSSVFDQ
jgi:hypothetical protein